LISSCREKKPPQLQLIYTKTITDFPSASAIEYDSGRLYVFGDDAPYLLVLDTAYNRLDMVRYSIDTAFRINRDIKSDIESATLINYDGEKHLYALGSLSDSGRTKLFYFPLSDIHTYLSIDYAPFLEKLKSIPEVNIEGMSVVRSKFVLANRANETHRVNKLIITGTNLYEHKSMPPPVIIDLHFDSARVIGISGLYYVEEKDILFFTASEEETRKATEDGTINDSYLGWINSFSTKMEKASIKPEGLIRLGSVHKAFTKQKVESVCVQSINDGRMILHLVSDNDNGQSGLFKLQLNW
jgi:hypothetical protein